MSKFKEAVATLLKNGCTEETGLVVKSAKVNVGDTYTTVSITFSNDRKIARYLPTDDDATVYERTESYTAPILISSFVRILKEDDELVRIASHVDAHPKCLEALLPGTKLDIVLQDVKAHATYSDPFSEKTPEKENDEDYDRIFYHISSLALNKKGQEVADKILDKILGF